MERVKLKIKVIIPIYDRLGYMIPAGDYEILVTRITNAHVYGNIGQIEFSLPLRQLLKVISQQQYPTLGIRTALPPVTRHDSLSPVNGNSCMICLSTMRDTPVTLPCEHNFHRDCITTWLRRGTNSCPICRMDFCEDIIINEYPDPVQYEYNFIYTNTIIFASFIILIDIFIIGKFFFLYYVLKITT